MIARDDDPILHRIAAEVRAAAPGERRAPDALAALVDRALQGEAASLDTFARREALLRVARQERFLHALGQDAAPLPDVAVLLADQLLTPALLHWAQSVWAQAYGRSLATTEPPLARALAALEPFAPGARPAWPVPVDHPLDRLLDGLRAGNAIAAYWYLRDTAEGLVRVAWVLYLADVLALLAERADGLASLSERQAAACRGVLDLLVGGAFSMGAALHHLIGERPGDGGLAALRDVLPADGPSALLRRSFDEAPRVQQALRSLRDWRNADPGHGIIGSDQRVMALLAGKGSHRPLAHLAEALFAGGPWLAEAQRTLPDWPDLGAARAAAQGDRPLQGAPEPLAFTGGGAALWLAERFVPGKLQLRDIVGGDRKNHPVESQSRALAERLSQTGWSPSPLDLSPREESEAVHRRTSVFEQRAMRTPLVDALGAALARTPGWHAVTGAAGTGKSFLLRQVVEHVRGSGALPGSEPGATTWVPLVVDAVPGERFWARQIAHRLYAQITEPSANLVVPRDEGGRRAVLSEEGEAARAFWGELVRANPSRRFLVVLDGLDEIGEAMGESLSVLPPDEPGVAEATRVVLGFRSRGELPRGVAEAVPGDLPELDAGAYFGTEEGRATLRRYLRKHHKPLFGQGAGAVGEHLAEEVIERAEGRFLWVFHLARGLEVGFLRQDEPLATWPTGEDFYLRYLAWLQRRVAHHAGYVRTLQDVLLTVALSPIALNDRTLLWLLGAGPAEDQAAEQERYLAWLRPVLEDLEDFLDRRRVNVGDTAASDDLRRAALVVVHDAEVRLGDAFVRRVAHATLRHLLRGGELPEPWQEARERVARHMAERSRELLGASPAGDVSGAAERYVQQCHLPLIAQAEGAEAAVAEVEPYLSRAPELFQVVAYPDHWCVALRAAVEALPNASGTPGGAELRRAYLLGRLGSALADAGREVEAAAVHAEEVGLKRALARLAPGADAQAVRAAIARSPGAVRDLSTGLGRLGGALAGARRAVEAAAVHTEEVRLFRALAGLAPGADAQATRAAIAHSPGAVRDLAVGLGTLGGALVDSGRAVEAAAVHTEEVGLERALAGLAPGADAQELRAAIARSPGAVNELSIGLGALGRALAAAGRAVDAAAVHREEVGLERALAGLAPGADAPEVRAAIARSPDAVRNLSIGLGRLGSALTTAGRAVEAAAVLPEEVGLFRTLAELAPGTDARQVRAAIVRSPSAVRDLAISLGALGRALADAGRAVEAAAVHSEEVVLCRAQAGLAPGTDAQKVRAAVARSPGAVRELSLGLGRLGSALARAGRTVEATSVHTEEVGLFRALAGLAPGADAQDARSAIARSPGAVRELSMGLGNLGWALADAGRAVEAAAVHREEVGLCRALAGLAPGADAQDVRAAIARSPGAVSELATGLRTLGWALAAAGRAVKATAVLTEGVGLCRALAGLAPGADAQDVRAAIARSPGAVRELASGLRTLGWALDAAGHTVKATAVHTEAVGLDRALAGLAEGADAQDVQAAIARSPDAVRGLSNGLGRLGEALARAGRAVEAAAAHSEEVGLKRTLAELAPGADAKAVRAAIARSPDAVRELALGLYRLGMATPAALRAHGAHLREALRLFDVLVEHSRYFEEERVIVAGAVHRLG